MSQFVRPGPLGGYRPVSGGHSDPDCTHVILTVKEYDALLDKIKRAEMKSDNAKYDADRAIERIKSDAAYRINQAGEAARQQIAALEHELAEARAEVEHQRGLNDNLLRISRERANSDRKLKPKKEHTGFVVVMSSEKEFRYKDGYRNWRTVMLRETVLQSPYSVDFTEDQARKQIFEALLGENKRGGLIAKIGITAVYSKGDYADLISDLDWADKRKQHNIMIEPRLKANFKSGYWELIFRHTKPLGVVPKEMRAC